MDELGGYILALAGAMSEAGIGHKVYYRVPAQFIAKLFTEALGEAPTKATFDTYATRVLGVREDDRATGRRAVSSLCRLLDADVERRLDRLRFLTRLPGLRMGDGNDFLHEPSWTHRGLKQLHR